MDQTAERLYIARIRNGDSAAYAFIVDEYKYMAYTLAVKILKNQEDAEDASQESFIKAYQQINQFEGKSKFSTWLYTIVYRTAISKQKEKRIQTTVISPSINENYPEDDESSSDLESTDEQRHVRAAIDRLPTPDGLIVTLFYVNESSVKEIQLITGLSAPNIKIRLFRARKKLERELHFLLESKSVHNG
jgi:RNA polymerase sigma factor (sigma-70 family)